jgi:hypothetical protein
VGDSASAGCSPCLRLPTLQHLAAALWTMEITASMHTCCLDLCLHWAYAAHAFSKATSSGFVSHSCIHNTIRAGLQKVAVGSQGLNLPRAIMDRSPRNTCTLEGMINVLLHTNQAQHTRCYITTCTPQGRRALQTPHTMLQGGGRQACIGTFCLWTRNIMATTITCSPTKPQARHSTHWVTLRNINTLPKGYSPPMEMGWTKLELEK